RTNTILGRTNTFNFNHGSLTTLHGATIIQSDHLPIGNTLGQTSTWTMAAGTNLFALGGSNELRLGTAGQAIMTVNGTALLHTNAVVVGYASPWNQLLIRTNTSFLGSSVTIGKLAASTNNFLSVAGGTLIATNASGSGTLLVGEAGGGTLSLDGGVIVADLL